MTDGVWFGDIAVSLISDKNTDITVDTIEKNFVEGSSQLYKLNSNLESGTYTLFLNSKYHPKDESLRVQRDAFKSMPHRHVTEFPYQDGGEQGYILPESVTTIQTSSEEFDEGQITLRFLDDCQYRPAIDVEAKHFSDDFSPEKEESLIAIPSIVENVEGEDGSLSPEYTGKLDYYTYEDNVIEYDLPDSDFTAAERTSPVRVYDSFSMNERIYSPNRELANSSTIENNVIYSETQTSLEKIYDESKKLLGDVKLDASTSGYLRETGNYYSEIHFHDSYSKSVRRGFPFVGYSFSGKNTFEFSLDNTFLTFSENGYYVVVEDEENNEIIVIATDSDGFWNSDSETVSRENLDSTKEYTFFVGYNIGIPNAELARYMYNVGSVKRTLVQR